MKKSRNFMVHFAFFFFVILGVSSLPTVLGSVIPATHTRQFNFTHEHLTSQQYPYPKSRHPYQFSALKEHFSLKNEIVTPVWPTSVASLSTLTPFAYENGQTTRFYLPLSYKKLAGLPFFTTSTPFLYYSYYLHNTASENLFFGQIGTTYYSFFANKPTSVLNTPLKLPYQAVYTETFAEHITKMSFSASSSNMASFSVTGLPTANSRSLKDSIVGSTNTGCPYSLYSPCFPPPPPPPSSSPLSIDKVWLGTPTLLKGDKIVVYISLKNRVSSGIRFYVNIRLVSQDYDDFDLWTGNYFGGYIRGNNQGTFSARFGPFLQNGKFALNSGSYTITGLKISYQYSGKSYTHDLSYLITANSSQWTLQITNGDALTSPRTIFVAAFTDPELSFDNGGDAILLLQSLSTKFYQMFNLRLMFYLFDRGWNPPDLYGLDAFQIPDGPNKVNLDAYKSYHLARAAALKLGMTFPVWDFWHFLDKRHYYDEDSKRLKPFPALADPYWPSDETNPPSNFKTYVGVMPGYTSAKNHGYDILLGMTGNTNTKVDDGSGQTITGITTKVSNDALYSVGNFIVVVQHARITKWMWGTCWSWEFGYTWCWKKVVTTFSLDYAMFKLVLYHEFAHVWSADHIFTQPNIMNHGSATIDVWLADTINTINTVKPYIFR